MMIDIQPPHRQGIKEHLTYIDNDEHIVCTEILRQNASDYSSRTVTVTVGGQ